MMILYVGSLCKTSWVSVLIAVIPVLSYSQSPAQNPLLKLQADAQRGDLAAEIELAGRYLVGNGVSRNAGLAAHWYEKAAQRGNSDAQNQMGYFYQSGIGVPVDLARARNWYQLAATSGSTAGKLNLGILYMKGLGVPRSMPMAMQLFEEGARKGDGTAAAYLGQIYYFGLAGTKDVNAAEKWFQVGAQLHDPMAAYNLGSLYSVAADHLHDLPKASVFLRQSAESGYVNAMYSLGLLLVDHPELGKTPYEAQTWLDAAMSAGDWRSSLLLGILARDGKGTPVDKKSALYHFEIAALQGGEEGKRKAHSDIERLRKDLGPDELAAISSAAQARYQQHPSSQSFVVNDPAKAKFKPLPGDPSAMEGLSSQ